MRTGGVGFHGNTLSTLLERGLAWRRPLLPRQLGSDILLEPCVEAELTAPRLLVQLRLKLLIVCLDLW